MQRTVRSDPVEFCSAALGESHIFLGHLLSFRKHTLRASHSATAGGEGRQISPLQGGRQKGKEVACPSGECDQAFSWAHGENVAMPSGIGPGKAAQRQAGGDGDGHATVQQQRGRRRPTLSFYP